MSDEQNSNPPAVEHDALPLPDYDHLPLESLKHRIRTLTQDQLAEVLAYEEAHGNRLPVVQAMRVRLGELKDGAEPSGGSPEGYAPEQAPPARGGSPVFPETTGPPMNPPSHGTPENPAQPRTTS